MPKFPEDLRVYEHLLWLDGPDTVIELGTHLGGSALWFRDRLTTMRNYGRITGNPTVVTVDISQIGARQTLTDCGNAAGIELVEGDLCDPEIGERVASLIGDRCLVVDDSAHTYETTSAALENYSRFVPPGGFMVIEDGCVDDEHLRLPDWPRGVRPAIDAWLASSGAADFVVRRDLELYGITSHPSGFLQRRSGT